jgi:hypothetical protein
MLSFGKAGLMTKDLFLASVKKTFTKLELAQKTLFLLVMFLLLFQIERHWLKTAVVYYNSKWRLSFLLLP